MTTLKMATKTNKHPSENLPIPVSATSKSLGARPGTVDKVIFDGDWGHWKGWKGVNDGGYYACGAEMRFEDPCGDDTAANGLRFKYCHLQDWSAQKTAAIYNGIWGSWKGMQMCPFDYYVDGAQVRFEDNQGSGDDTALNGLKIRCRHKSRPDKLHWATVYSGVWGSWKQAVSSIDKYVKLANIRFEDALDDGDDTAWNGLSLRYETPTDGLSKAPVEGRWSNYASGPTISTTLTESMETSSGKNLSREEASSVSITVEAGYDFPFGISGSASVTGEYSKTTAQTLSSTITLKGEKKITVSCPAGASSTGFWVMWVWVMNQDTDDTGTGFIMESNQFRCTTSIQEFPKCPLGMCSDNLCQTCTGPLLLLGGADVEGVEE